MHFNLFSGVRVSVNMKRWRLQGRETIAGMLVLISKKGEILMLTVWTDSSLGKG